MRSFYVIRLPSVSFTDIRPCQRNKHDSRPHPKRQNYGSHMIARVHNIAHINCRTCTYFFQKQNAKIFVWKFSAIIKVSVAKFIFSKIPYFQLVLLNTFRQMHPDYENYSLRRILFQTFKKHYHSKNLILKTFDGITTKMKVASPFQVTNEKMNAVSRPDVHTDFDFARPLFACPFGLTSENACQKNQARRSKFVQLCYFDLKCANNEPQL